MTGIEHVALVAGGIGQTPFLAYVRELLGERGYGGKPARRAVQRASLFYGVRTAAFAAGVEEFRAAGAEVHLATDDGSLGFHGFVTQLLETQQSPQHLVGCGPEPMMKALARLAERWGIPCHLSLETPMACGVGICFSCVTKVRTADGWDYRRVCVEGPIFDAATLAWDEGARLRPRPHFTGINNSHSQITCPWPIRALQSPHWIDRGKEGDPAPRHLTHKGGS